MEKSYIFNNIKKLWYAIIFFSFCLINIPKLYGQNNYAIAPEVLKFIISYETIKPVEPERIVFYSSLIKNSAKNDSIVYRFSNTDSIPDTIFIQSKWNFPVFVKLKMESDDAIRYSNEFYYYPGNNSWNIAVTDSSLKVNLRDIRNFANPYKPMIGIILLIQTILEMILALIMSQMIGWSRTIWVMVLTANIASFPIYMISFKYIWMRELVVLVTKTFVMSVIGYRKIKLYKIILFAIGLLVVSFGLKEILFILMRVI